MSRLSRFACMCMHRQQLGTRLDIFHTHYISIYTANSIQHLPYHTYYAMYHVQYNVLSPHACYTLHTARWNADGAYTWVRTVPCRRRGTSAPWIVCRCTCVHTLSTHHATANVKVCCKAFSALCYSQSSLPPPYSTTLLAFFLLLTLVLLVVFFTIT